MLIIVVILYLLVILLELPGLIKKGWYKEIAAFSIVFLIGVYLGMAQFYHWPNPYAFIIPLLPNAP